MFVHLNFKWNWALLVQTLALFESIIDFNIVVHACEGTPKFDSSIGDFVCDAADCPDNGKECVYNVQGMTCSCETTCRLK